jgi:tRNA-2-methylthio-N6-dimethylallyladenosine synthase
MNRRHNREFFLDVIKRIREKHPTIAIGTDIIVGFCGETEEQFQDTVSLYEVCDFDISYHAQYSTRSGTVAARAFTDDVPKAEKKRRWQVLQKMMEERGLEMPVPKGQLASNPAAVADQNKAKNVLTMEDLKHGRQS